MASKGIPEKFRPPVTLILPKRMFGSKKVESKLVSAVSMVTLQHQPRLNYLMILNIYKEQLDDVDLSSIANEFVCGSEHRMHVFGKF